MNKNSGIILISTLIFLLLLTLLAMNILQIGLLETKMSTNYKDNISLLHQAEAKLRKQERLLQNGITPLPSEVTLISTNICGVKFYRIRVNFYNEFLQSTYAVINDASNCNPKPTIKPGRQSWIIRAIPR